MIRVGSSQVFASPGEVPSAPRPGDPELRSSGYSIIVYGAVEHSGPVAVVDGENRADDPRGYLAKLYGGHQLRYEVGPRAEVGLVGRTFRFVPTILRSDVSGLGLLVVPIRFSQREGAWDTVLDAPAGIDELLMLIGQLASPPGLARVLAAAAAELGIDGAVRPLEETVGVQLWDLHGTDDWEDRPFVAVADSRAFSWELSALLQFTTDHVGVDGLWRSRDPDQVFLALKDGYTYLGDHMVFVSRSACVEITHMGSSMRDRSSFRLATYGYDSSSLFVWALMLYRSYVVDSLLFRYQTLNGRLLESGQISEEDQSAVIRRLLADRRALDQVVALEYSLLEQRNAALASRILEERAASMRADALERELGRSEEALVELVRIREERQQHKVNLLIGSLAAVLAILGVPAFIGEVTDMVELRQWTRFGVSALLVLIATGMVVGAWRRRG